jgi:guanine deaminase
MTQLTRKIFAGTFVHSKTLSDLEILHDTTLFVDEHGRIAAIEPTVRVDDAAAAKEAARTALGWAEEQDGIPISFWKGGKEMFWFPGFVGE